MSTHVVGAGPLAAKPPLARRPCAVPLLALTLAVLLGGCVTGAPRASMSGGLGLSAPSVSWRPSTSSSRPAPSPLHEPTADAFQQVQEASGLEPGARHPAGAALYLEQARQLLRLVARTPVTRRTFAPCRVMSWLLREVIAGGERVEYANLRWRAERFVRLVVVRPDGYLVNALTGAPIQHLGSVQFVDFQWRVGRLAVGAFYFSNGGVFYPVTGALRRAGGPPLAELGLGRDPLNAALDGAQEAMEEMVLALAQSIHHPIRTVADLAQLPDTVARLIASSPEYFARYGDMSREDQIREAARLSTHVLMMLGGGAEATAGGLGGLGAELPLLSLSADGELVLEETLVAGGTATVTVNGGLAIPSVLHMASRGQGKSGEGRSKSGDPSQAAPAKEPGQWVYKTPTNPSKEAMDYQEQVTEQPAWRVYVVENLEFDGFKAGELLEAKGPGYCSFFNADGTPKYWYKNSGKFDEMLVQARKQSKLARDLGISLTWHVADAKVAEFLRKLFKEEGLTNTTVRHTAPAGR